MTLLKKWCDAWRARLIDDAHRFYKFASIQVAAAYAAVAVFIQTFPREAREIWDAVPQDMRAMLPGWLTSALPFLMLGTLIVARITKKKESSNG